MTFKSCFATEYNDLRDQQHIESTEGGYHSADQSVEMTGALDNLVITEMSDKDIVT